MDVKLSSEMYQLAFDFHQIEDEIERELPGSYPIDTDFPEAFANALSQKEVYNKHLFRPNTYLHKWWARRCGTTFRTILKQLVTDADRRDFYAPGGLEGYIVLDPMMGGGTTLHEAIRMGARVIGADIDPIPVLQARATLSDLSLTALTRDFHAFFETLYRKVGPFFQTTCPHCQAQVDVQFTLYGVRKRCECGEVVQIDQFDLRHEETHVVRILPQTWEVTTSPAHHTRPAIQNPLPLITKKQTKCPNCGQKYQAIFDEPYFQRYVPIAVAGWCPTDGFFLRAPDEKDLDLISQANTLRTSLEFGTPDDFRVKNGPKSRDLLRHHIANYLDLFTSRQLLYLYHATEILQNFSGASKLNLAMLLSTSLEFNALLCGYKGWAVNRPGAIRHVFAHHAYSFPYTAAENNPVNLRKASGNLQALFSHRIVRGRRWASQPKERWVNDHGKTRIVTIPGEFDGGTEVHSWKELQQTHHAFWVMHRDARQLPLPDESIDFIVTDPPYYDSVQYSDLAAFFRVWLAHFLPDEMDWHYDVSKSAVANDVQGRSQFKDVLGEIFKESFRVLKKTGRLVFTYHHWDPNAWADLTIILKNAGFYLVNTYVVFSENPISVHIRNLNAIKHDAILVLAKDPSLNSRIWPPLDGIDTSDSAAFCRECGEALGWLLESNMDDETIRATWKHLIRGEKA